MHFPSAIAVASPHPKQKRILPFSLQFKQLLGKPVTPMKIKALARSVALPEKVEPNTCTLAIHTNGPSSPTYRAVHMHWHEFQQLLARNGNQELRGKIFSFAVHPSQQEIQLYPLPGEDAEAVFRYSPIMRQI